MNKDFKINHFPYRLNLTVHVNFRDDEKTLLHEIDLYCKLCGISRQAFLKGCAVEFLSKEFK